MPRISSDEDEGCRKALPLGGDPKESFGEKERAFCGDPNDDVRGGEPITISFVGTCTCAGTPTVTFSEVFGRDFSLVLVHSGTGDTDTDFSGSFFSVLEPVRSDFCLRNEDTTGSLPLLLVSALALDTVCEDVDRDNRAEGFTLC